MYDGVATWKFHPSGAVAHPSRFSIALPDATSIKPLPLACAADWC
jgi:hypothetical protein